MPTLFLLAYVRCLREKIYGVATVDRAAKESRGTGDNRANPRPKSTKNTRTYLRGHRAVNTPWGVAGADYEPGFIFDSKEINSRQTTDH